MAMASADGELRKVVRRILGDIRVELGDEFDQNFERQGFFAEKWQRRKSPMRGDGHILVASGDLRKSIRSRSDESSITFYSDLAYAGIHNEGARDQGDGKDEAVLPRQVLRSDGNDQAER